MESPLAEEPESSYGRRRRSSAAPVRPAGPPAGALAGAPAGAPDASPATCRSNKSGNETADLAAAASQARPSTGRPAIRRVPPPLVAAKPSTQAAPDAVLSGAQQAVDAESHKGSTTHSGKLFFVGQQYFHDQHGAGEVIGVDGDSVVTIRYKDGNQRFTPAQHHTLRPFIDDADNYTAETLFQMCDTDSSGHINLSEFTFLHAMLKTAQEKNARLVTETEKAEKEHLELASSLRQKVKTARGWMCAVIVFIIVLLGLFACVTFAFFKEFITTGEKNGFMAAGNGRVLKTSPALFALPLIVAPVLPWEQLKEVSSLTVSYYDPHDSDVPDQKIMASVNIVNVLRVNQTAVRFDATSGHRVKAIRVWNGEALVVFDDDTTANACMADVRCSALTSTDGDRIEEQTEYAYEVLHEMGFTQNLVTDDQGRRRLAEGSCDAPKTWCADGLFAPLP